MAGGRLYVSHNFGDNKNWMGAMNKMKCWFSEKNRQIVLEYWSWPCEAWRRPD